MKTLTCRELGGMCDEPITAGSQEEMLAKGMEHLEKAHPEMAQAVKTMPQDDPKMVEWSEGFKKTWEGTPEDAEGEGE